MSEPFALHLVTDRLESRLDLALAVAAAVRGGVDAIQVREKGQPAEVALRTAEEVRRATPRALVLINDRADVALAAGADGIHLPARGLPPGVARGLLPKADGWLVGVSVHSVEEATAAVAAGADYVTFGHIFPTGSKPGLPSRGLEALAEVVAAVPAPVLAIGGITAENVGRVLQTGCAGVAVIRALLQEADPERAAAKLREAMERSGAHPRRVLRATGRSRGSGRMSESGRIPVTLNGKPAEVPAGESLLAYLRSRGVDPERVVAAVNGEIVPRERWSALVPEQGDRIEVVHVVAGGGSDDDPLVIAGVTFTSRLICGTGKFPSAEAMSAALIASGCEMVTVAVRYFDLELGGRGLLQQLDTRRYRMLPNTAGAYTAEDAIHMAELARAATGTTWIKLEVIGDKESLWPDVAATVAATRELVRRGFVVLPYTAPDPVAAVHLEEAGAATVMPLGSPIGSGQGVLDVGAIRRIVRRVKVPVVVDAGIGSPADAAMAMEAGASACLINTAIARAEDPVAMAEAMALGIRAGRLGFRAGRIQRQAEASPSTTTTGVPRIE